MGFPFCGLSYACMAKRAIIAHKKQAIPQNEELPACGWDGIPTQTLHL